MFGVANQLLAAVAFGVGTVVIMKSGKLKYSLVTFIPMVFMFSTTFTASWKLMGMFADKISHATSKSESLTFRIDAFLVMLMAALAAVVLFDLLRKFYEYFSGKIVIPDNARD